MVWASATSTVLACLACSARALASAPPVAHGRYTVQSGELESCWSVAENLCKDGNDWKSVICNGADVCTNLQPGTVLNYDCSGKGTYCNSPIEGHGSYTVLSVDDRCWNIADKLCQDGGINDWKTIFCNSADVCYNLQPGQVLNYDCSGKRKYCNSPIEAHGNYTVQSGDECMDIADSVCQDGGNDWKTVICNGAAVCNTLFPGQVLNYDCSGKGTYCKSPIEGHGRYTVQSGELESCWAVAENLCKDGNDWKSVICNGADVCNNLQPGTVLNYDCSGKGKYCTNTIEGRGSYTVQSGDLCWDIANSLCQDGGNDWKTVICNGADVCSNLHPGQVLNYDCSGKGTYCNSPIEAHGTYTVQSGDICWDIAGSLCQDGGKDWKTVICNGAAVCNTLVPGQVLSYDCSGKSTYCNSPIEAPTEIIV